MRVEILNPEVVENLYKNHGQFACVCYNTDEKYAEKVGESCQKDGHMSGSRCEYIKFHVYDIDRGTAEQALRHEIGTYVPFEYQDNYTFADYSEVVVDVNPGQIIKNMASFRYINKDGFNYEMPKTIRDNEKAKEIYEDIMDYINCGRKKIKTILEESGIKPNIANQDANFVLPRATLTEFVIGFTPESLIHFCHKRLCTRAQEFIRQMAVLMKNEVKKYSPKFSEELLPQCQHLMWCPEGNRCCGLSKTKEDLKNLLKDNAIK